MSKLTTVLAGFFIFVFASCALGISPGAGADPQQLVIYDLFAGGNASGTLAPGVGSAAVPIGSRTARSNALVNGETTLVVGIIGDSISANSGPSAYTVTQTKVENLNIYSAAGDVYDYKDPVIGASDGPGSQWGILGDRLRSTSRYARVIYIDPSIGGSTSIDWGKAGNLNNRARVACLQARALGWPVSGSGNGGNWKMVWLYRLGTNDKAVGTSPSNFTAAAQSTFQTLRDYGCTAKILVSTVTMVSNVVDAGLQAAQAGLVDNVTTFAGDNLDSLTGGTNRSVDGTHLTLTGETNDSPLVDTALSNAGL